jgi:hypothetical protein
MAFGSLPLIALAGFAVAASFEATGTVQLMFNGYVAVLGISTIISGSRLKTIRKINAGMVMISTLIVIRFFDSSLGILSRGIVFTVLGFAFLTINLILAKKFKKAAERN